MGIDGLLRGALVVTLCLLMSAPASAVILQSPSYRFDESSIGTDSLQGASSSYKISASTNDLAVGKSASNNLQIANGTKTTPDPTLSFAVTKADATFSTFSPSSTASATAEFQVKNYTSYGYAVQIYGTPPKSNSHTIAPISDVPTASQLGIEQFGINLVANTSPSSLGKNPDNDNGFGFGAAGANYLTSNKYYFVSGDTIASAPKSSGQTSYTISYIANVTGLTPGGTYKSDQMLVVIGQY